MCVRLSMHFLFLPLNQQQRNQQNSFIMPDHPGLPVKESDAFWDKVINDRNSKKSDSTSTSSSSSTTRPHDPNTTDTIDPEIMADPKKQHEFLDSFRSTDGIDYEQLRREATELVELRKSLEAKKKISEYRKIGKERYPNFAKKFPQFFESIRTCESNRLKEFLNVMHLMLSKLTLVKNNAMTHTEMRNEVFEKNLAHKYYKSK